MLMNGADSMVLADYGNKTTGPCPVQCPYTGSAFITYLQKIVSSAVSCLNCFLFSPISSLLLSSENLWNTLHVSIQVLDFKYFWWFLFSPWWPTAKLPLADSGPSNGYPDPLHLVPLWAMLVWCEVLGYGNTVVEDLSILVCDTVSCGQIVPDVSKDSSAFFFRVKQSKKCGTLGSTHPAAQVPS